MTNPASLRLRSTQSRLPALLSKEAYERLDTARDLRNLQVRIAHRLHLEAVQTPEELALYEQEWGRPQSLQQEITEVKRLIASWRSRRPGAEQVLMPILNALQNQLDDQRQSRTASVREEDGMIRLASLDEIPEDFVALGSGFYRQGHSIWSLRGAEDEEGGYVVTRLREERAVDLRPAPAAPTAAEPRRACASCLPAGTSAVMIRQGQTVPVIVVNVGGEAGKEEVEVEEEETGEHVMSPLDMIVTDMTVQMPSLQGMGGQMPGMLDPTQMGSAMPAQMPSMAPAQMPMQSPGQALQQVLRQAPEMIGEGEAMMTSGMDEAKSMSTCDCDQGCSCPCHNGKSVKKGPVQGMEPSIEPSSKDPDAGGGPESMGSPDRSPAQNEGQNDAQEDEPPSEMEKQGAIGRAFIMRAFGPEEAWGKTVAPTKSFAPQYMGGRFTFNPDDRSVYTVEGTSRADPQRDRSYGIPNPILPYPNARGGAEWALNDRVRLVPHGGGETIFVSPMELERNFELAEGSAFARRPERDERVQHRVKDDPNATPPWDDYRANPDMPGEALPPGEPTTEPVMDPKLTGTNLNEISTAPGFLRERHNPSITQVVRPPTPQKPGARPGVGRPGVSNPRMTTVTRPRSLRKPLPR